MRSRSPIRPVRQLPRPLRHQRLRQRAERFALNQECCQLPFTRNVVVTANELLGRVTYPSQIGQDKWVLEAMFPAFERYEVHLSEHADSGAFCG